jgi:hypothetical protein
MRGRTVSIMRMGAVRLVVRVVVRLGGGGRGGGDEGVESFSGGRKGLVSGLRGGGLFGWVCLEGLLEGGWDTIGMRF